VNNKTGILSPVNDPEKLAADIINLIENPERLSEMSNEAKKWSDDFTWDAAAEHFVKTVCEQFPELKG